MMNGVPDYWGVGFFGESLFQLPVEDDLDEDKLREMYPELFED